MFLIQLGNTEERRISGRGYPVMVFGALTVIGDHRKLHVTVTVTSYEREN